MNTDVASYEFVSRNEDEFELYGSGEYRSESSDVTYVVCSNFVEAEGRTLNMEYHAEDDLRKFSPDILVTSRSDGLDERVSSGRIRLEVYDSSGELVGEREAAISDLGHGIQPGFGFVPYVKINEGIKPGDVSEVRVFIVCG
jgi:hypothetical protein